MKRAGGLHARLTKPTRIQKTGKEIGKIFLAGVLLFIGIMGFITLFALFLAHVKT